MLLGLPIFLLIDLYHQAIYEEKPFCHNPFSVDVSQSIKWLSNSVEIIMNISNSRFILLLKKHLMFENDVNIHNMTYLNHYKGYVKGYSMSNAYGWIDRYFYGIIIVGKKTLDIENCNGNPKIMELKTILESFSGLLIDHINGHVNQPKLLFSNHLKRSSSSSEFKIKNICTLSVYIDSSIPSNEYNFIYTVIQRVNIILSHTVLTNSNNPNERLQFKIIKFETNLPFGSKHSQDSLLEEFSLIGHEKTCGAILFTNVDFNNGVAGVAYVGQPNGIIGGLCDGRPASVPSFNTIVVTNTVFKRKLPLAVQDIVVIHEIGHSIGSGHDKPVDSNCSPSILKGGTFLMFPRTPLFVVSENNMKFSQCSINEIEKVIPWKAEKCFLKSTLCGNNRIDNNEDCDCGSKEECKDNCCDYETCKLKYFAKCTPQNGPCCDDQYCILSPSTVVCEENSSCTKASFCSGIIEKCPKPHNLKDGTFCLEDHKCSSGICTYDPCIKFSLSSCLCLVNYINHTDRYCNDCCIDKDNHCKPMSEFDRQMSLNVSKAGKICGVNYEGLCDQNGICRLEPSEITLLKLYKTKSVDLFEKIKKKLPLYIGISSTSGLVFAILLIGLMKLLIK